MAKICFWSTISGLDFLTLRDGVWYRALSINREVHSITGATYLICLTHGSFVIEQEVEIISLSYKA